MNNQVVRYSDAQRLVNINASRNIVTQGTAAPKQKRMPANKIALIRYRVIDRLISNKCK